MFVLEGESGLVAHFSRSEVLDGAREYIGSAESPIVALGCKTKEGCSVETHKCFLYHGLHFTMTTFHIEHHGDRYTTGKPLN